MRIYLRAFWVVVCQNVFPQLFGTQQFEKFSNLPTG